MSAQEIISEIPKLSHEERRNIVRDEIRRLGLLENRYWQALT